MKSMRWNKLTIEKLCDYSARKAALVNIPAEIERLEADYGRIRSATTDATPVQGGGCTREDMLLTNICVRGELQAQLEDTKVWIANMDEALSALSDEERLVLERFFVSKHKGSVERLCEELHIERTAAYNRKDAAVRHLTVILYGAVDT